MLHLNKPYDLKRLVREVDKIIQGQEFDIGETLRYSLCVYVFVLLDLFSFL